MFPNVRAEMARNNLNMTDMSERTGIPVRSLYDKISGRSKITIDDACSIIKALGVDMTIEELFSKAVG